MRSAPAARNARRDRRTALLVTLALHAAALAGLVVTQLPDTPTVPSGTATGRAPEVNDAPLEVVTLAPEAPDPPAPRVTSARPANEVGTKNGPNTPATPTPGPIEPRPPETPPTPRAGTPPAVAEPEPLPPPDVEEPGGAPSVPAAPPEPVPSPPEPTQPEPPRSDTPGNGNGPPTNPGNGNGNGPPSNPGNGNGNGPPGNPGGGGRPRSEIGAPVVAEGAPPRVATNATRSPDQNDAVEESRVNESDCTVALDARDQPTVVGRGDALFVFDEQGEPLWPDDFGGNRAERVASARRHLRVRGEAGLASLDNVTVVQTTAVLRPRFGGDTNDVVNVVVSAEEAERFRSAGAACRLAFVLP